MTESEIWPSEPKRDNGESWLVFAVKGHFLYKVYRKAVKDHAYALARQLHDQGFWNTFLLCDFTAHESNHEALVDDLLSLSGE